VQGLATAGSQDGLAQPLQPEDEQQPADDETEAFQRAKAPLPMTHLLAESVSQQS
jgi:hypothetical protein